MSLIKEEFLHVPILDGLDWGKVQHINEEYYGVKSEVISKTDKLGNTRLETVWVWNDKRIMFNLIKALQDRQTSFLGTFHNGKDHSVAHCKIHFDGYLLSNWNRYEFIKCKSSMYYSLANLNGMPMFSHNPDERKRQSEEFNHDYGKYWTGFDSGLDFDSKLSSSKACYEEVKLIKGIFDTIGLPYRLKASSWTNFHLLIPHKFLVELGLHTPRAQLDFNIRLVHKLRKVYLLQTLDPAGIGPQKLWKCDYSLVWKGDNPCVALPLNDYDFEHFKPEMLDPVNVKNLPNLGYRGLCLRSRFDETKSRAWIQEEIYNQSYCPTCKDNPCRGGKDGA